MVASPSPARSRMRAAAGSCAGGLAFAVAGFALPPALAGLGLCTCSLFTVAAAGTMFVATGSAAPTGVPAHEMASKAAMPNDDFRNMGAVADTIDYAGGAGP